MHNVLGFVVGILQTALSLLGFVQQHPELPPTQVEQVQQVAQQAVEQASETISSATAPSGQKEVVSVNARTQVAQENAQKGIVSICPRLSRHLEPGATDATTDGEVSELQQFLIEHHYGGEQGVTGTFDTGATKANLIAFQKDNGMEGLGVVGQKTIAAVTSGCVLSNYSHFIISPSATEGMSMYTDTDYNFSFEFPNGWLVMTAGDTASLATPDHVVKEDSVKSPDGHDIVRFLVVRMEDMKAYRYCTIFRYDVSAGKWFGKKNPNPGKEDCTNAIVDSTADFNTSIGGDLKFPAFDPTPGQYNPVILYTSPIGSGYGLVIETINRGPTGNFPMDSNARNVLSSFKLIHN